jgi:hypothetical protein
MDKALLKMMHLLDLGGRLIIDDRSFAEDDFVDATLIRLDVLHDPSHVRDYRRVIAVEPYAKLWPKSSE